MHIHQKNSKELYMNVNLVCLSIAVKNGKCYHFIISFQIVLFYLLFFLSSARSSFCCTVLSSYICLRIENKPEVSYVKISLICNVVDCTPHQVKISHLSAELSLCTNPQNWSPLWTGHGFPYTSKTPSTDRFVTQVVVAGLAVNKRKKISAIMILSKIVLCSKFWESFPFSFSRNCKKITLKY